MLHVRTYVHNVRVYDMKEEKRVGFTSAVKVSP